MIVGFTGTREGCTAKQLAALERLLATLPMTEAHHGECQGADFQFAQIANEMLLPDRVHVHPPMNEQYRSFKVRPGNIIHSAKPYHDRNRDIVNASDVLVGCPLTINRENSGGTWYTINYAQKVGKPVYVVWPDGSVVKLTGKES